MLSKIVLACALLSPLAHAEETYCALEEMHCEDCAQMVRDKVCDKTKYTTCDVKIINEKKELGQLHLVTKESTAKVDRTELGSVLKTLGYGIKTCQAKALKKTM